MSHTPLQDRLKKEIADKLKKDLSITNVHALPAITSVTVNVGINQRRFGGNKEMIAFIADSLATITGQRPSIRKSRKSIATFAIRENMIVGLAVTLRGKQMYTFIDRLVSYALPRIRDFRGLSTKFDGNGNYSIGLKDQSIFPEVPAPDANKIFGMQIQISTNTHSDEEAKALLTEIGFPFKKPEKKQQSVEASS